MDSNKFQVDYEPEHRTLKINLPEEIWGKIDHIIMTRHFEYRDFMDKALELWEKNKKEVEKIAKIQDPVYSFAYWLFRYSGLIQPIEQESGK